MSYQATFLSKGVINTFSGVLTLAEIEEASDRLYKDKELKENIFCILDFSVADLSKISHLDAKHPAAIDKTIAVKRPHLKVGFVSKEKETIDLCKTYIDTSKKFGSTWEYKIFEQMDKAIRWGEKN